MVKALIVDASVVYRSQMRAALGEIQGLEVVGVASNGRIALEKIIQTPIDLVILDLEMTEMGGIETVQELRARGLACKTLIFAPDAKLTPDLTAEAFRLGVSELVAKPKELFQGSEPNSIDIHQRLRGLLEPRISALFPEIFAHEETPPVLGKTENFPKARWDKFVPSIVVIGSSTGGPELLEWIFAELALPLRCPIVIAQHMPPVFTTEFAARLKAASGIPATEAKHGMRLQSNCIYVAPGDYHLRLYGEPNGAIISLDQKAPIHSVRPAIDPLFTSAAQVFGDKCLAFVLTGMGVDGKSGAVSVKQAGGAVVIQNEESSAVFGMPRAVMLSHAFDLIASPTEIVEILREKASTGDNYVSNLNYR